MNKKTVPRNDCGINFPQMSQHFIEGLRKPFTSLQEGRSLDPVIRKELA
jgi:hypothetical protein